MFVQERWRFLKKKKAFFNMLKPESCRDGLEKKSLRHFVGTSRYFAEATVLRKDVEGMIEWDFVKSVVKFLDKILNNSFDDLLKNIQDIF